MKALIDPRVQVQYLSSWELNPNPQSPQKYIPVYTVLPYSERVCEVVEQEFPVAEPLFWVDCPSDAVADQWYYDSQNSKVLQVPPPAPYPVDPGTQGTQTV